MEMDLAAKERIERKNESSVAATDGRGKGRANSPSEPLSRNNGSVGDLRKRYSSRLPNNSEPITDNPEHCSVAGHIDLLQYKYNSLYIRDCKRKVATQLNLYALALAKRANLSLAEIRCAWFNEEDFFSL